MSAVDCARVVVAALLRRGIRHVVLCPGSRSAPLALEVARLAAERQLTLHVRIDERVAGFLALGLARATGAVVPVITTSGTAVGNLQPAVMEAFHGGVPLLVVSADRPASMLHTGANQTTDQIGIFGRFVIADARISNSDGSPNDWSLQVERLVALASGDLGGPVGPAHLNLSLAAPLIDESVLDAAGGAPHVEAESPGAAIARPAYPIAGDLRTVVLVGDASPEQGAWARTLAEQYSLPLLAEPSSNARSGKALRGYRLLLDTELGRQIEQVLVVGHPTLSRPVTGLLTRAGVRRFIQPDRGRWTQLAAGDVLLSGDPVFTGAASVRREFLARWKSADDQISKSLDELLGDSINGPSIAREVAGALGSGAVLMVGSSNPIRDLDLAPVPERGPIVYANRGLAGIDGTISTAAGIAAGLDEPVTALLGDLTFLHDLGGLLCGPLESPVRLRLVVANDDGGSIFHLLEQGAPAYSEHFERVFGTPHGADISLLVQGFGWAHRRVESLADLRRCLVEPIVGREVIEVPLPRDGRRHLDARIRALAEYAG